jgi:hypothetical protein
MSVDETAVDEMPWRQLCISNQHLDRKLSIFQLAGLVWQNQGAQYLFVQLGFNRVTDKKSSSILIYFQSRKSIYTQEKWLDLKLD